MKSHTVTLALLAFLLGNSLPHVVSPPPAQAAPADVVGSACVAVDTYRNSKGTFVLWANGRITNAETGVVANGEQAYSAPTVFHDPPEGDTPGLKGSPHVAVKTVSRSDATYVLFADGHLKKPTGVSGNDDAALPQLAKGQFLVDTAPAGYASQPQMHFSPEEITNIAWEGRPSFTLTLAEPMENAQLFGMATLTDSEGKVSPQGLTLQKIDDRHYRVAAPTLPAGNTFSYALSFFLSSH